MLRKYSNYTELLAVVWLISNILGAKTVLYISNINFWLQRVTTKIFYINILYSAFIRYDSHYVKFNDSRGQNLCHFIFIAICCNIFLQLSKIYYVIT